MNFSSGVKEDRAESETMSSTESWNLTLRWVWWNLVRRNERSSGGVLEGQGVEAAELEGLGVPVGDGLLEDVLLGPRGPEAGCVVEGEGHAVGDGDAPPEGRDDFLSDDLVVERLGDIQRVVEGLAGPRHVEPGGVEHPLRHEARVDAFVGVLYHEAVEDEDGDLQAEGLDVLAGRLEAPILEVPEDQRHGAGLGVLVPRAFLARGSQHGLAHAVADAPELGAEVVDFGEGAFEADLLGPFVNASEVQQADEEVLGDGAVDACLGHDEGQPFLAVGHVVAEEVALDVVPVAQLEEEAGVAVDHVPVGEVHAARDHSPEGGVQILHTVRSPPAPHGDPVHLLTVFDDVAALVLGVAFQAPVEGRETTGHPLLVVVFGHEATQPTQPHLTDLFHAP
eukprot:scaffold149405_cov25-Prasinocladus_malaysianus.AAC.2